MNKNERDQNSRPSSSLLDENAKLYQKPSKRTEKEKWNSLYKVEKKEYFLEYYGLKTLAIVVIFVIIIFLGIQFITKKDVALYVVAVNAENSESSAGIDDYFKRFLEEHGKDIKEEEVSCQSSLFINATSEDTIDDTVLDNITTLFITQSVDVFMADEGFYGSMAGTDYIADITEYLPAEVIEKYADNIVYVKNEVTGEKFAAGIQVNNNEWMQNYGFYKDEAVIGLADSVVHPDLAVALILEILGEN